MAGFRTGIQFLKALALFLLLAACLFGGSGALGISGVLSSLVREVQAIGRDPGTQWMVFACGCVYFVTFAMLQCRRTNRRVFAWGNELLWLSGALTFAAFAYATDYSTSSQSLQPLILIIGATLGLGFGTWTSWGSRPERGTGFQPVIGQQAGCLFHLGKPASRMSLVLVSLVGLLAVAAFWKAEGPMTFRYRGEARWSGPWDNPNEYGVLMAVGVVLAVGCAVASSRFQVPSSKLKWLRWPILGLCLLAAILTGIGLFKSYSRGAWLGAVGGLAYLAWKWMNHEIRESHEREHEETAYTDSERRAQSDEPCLKASNIPSGFSCLSCLSWFQRNWRPLSVVSLSVVVILFWTLRHTEFAPVRRLFSAGNVNDFSWRNRVDAWEGSLQIMADKPWLGWGWNRPEQVYDNYYRDARLEEGMAIQLNDYFTLGMAVGAPALVGFGVCVFLAVVCRPLSVVRGPTREPTDNRPLTFDFGMKAVCGAGAIVLLVGFWFDGGLFKLHLAAPFWILLSLGAMKAHERSKTDESEPRAIPMGGIADGATDHLWALRFRGRDGPPSV